MKRVGAKLLLCGKDTPIGVVEQVLVLGLQLRCGITTTVVKVSIQTSIVIAQIRFQSRRCGNRVEQTKARSKVRISMKMVEIPFPLLQMRLSQ